MGIALDNDSHHVQMPGSGKYEDEGGCWIDLSDGHVRLLRGHDLNSIDKFQAYLVIIT